MYDDRIPIQKTQFCGICFQEGQLITLECSHLFCKQCLKIQFTIKELQKGNFKCPDHKCNKILTSKSISLFIDNLDKETSNLLKQNIVFDLRKNEILMQCLNENCQNRFIIWENADYYQCTECNLKFCLKCKKAYHENLTCIEAYNLRNQSQSRIVFMKKAVQQFQNQICPHCFTVVEKNEGCNFITCTSQSCKKQKYFCYLCGVALERGDSSAHFKDRDSFNKECLIKVNGKWIDREKIPNNEIPCPLCKTIDPRFSRIEGNLIICDSQQCQHKIFCKICQRVLNDKTIIDHLGPIPHQEEQKGLVSKIFKWMKS